MPTINHLENQIADLQVNQYAVSTDDPEWDEMEREIEYLMSRLDEKRAEEELNFD